MIENVKTGQKITASKANEIIDDVNALVDDKSRVAKNKSFRNIVENNHPNFLQTRSSLLSGFGQNYQVYLGQNVDFARNLLRVNHTPVDEIRILSGSTFTTLSNEHFQTNGPNQYFDGFVNTRLSTDLKLSVIKTKINDEKKNIAIIGDGSLPAGLSVIENYTRTPILLQTNNYFGQNRALKHGHIGMVDIAELSATAISVDTDATENQKSIEFSEEDEYLQLYNFDKLSAVISADLSSLSSLNDISADILLRQLSNDNIFLNYIPLSTLFVKVDVEGLSSKSIERDLSSNELRLFDFLDPESLTAVNDDDKVLLRRVIDDVPTLKYVDLSSIILSSAIISGDADVIADKSITYVKTENDQYYQLYDWHADKTDVALSDAILYRHDNELRYGYLSSVNFVGDEKAIHTNLSAGKHELKDWNLSNKIDLSAVVKQGGNLSANNWNSLSTPNDTKVEFLVRQAPNAQSNEYTLKYAALKINLQNPTLSTNVDTAISAALPDVKTQSIDKKLSAIENENVAYLQLHNFDLSAADCSAIYYNDNTYLNLDSPQANDWYEYGNISAQIVLSDENGILENPKLLVKAIDADGKLVLRYADISALHKGSVPWLPTDATPPIDADQNWDRLHTKSVQNDLRAYGSPPDYAIMLYKFDQDISADNTPAMFDANIAFDDNIGFGADINDYLNAVDPEEVLVPLQQFYKDGPWRLNAEVLMRQKYVYTGQAELMKGTVSATLPDFVGSDTVKTNGDYQSLDVVANTSLKDSYWQLHDFGVAGEELQPEDLSDYNFVCWKSNNGKYELEHRPIDIDALYEGLSGEISGIAGRIIAEVSGEISGDYWPQGGYNENCYGFSIGRSDKKVVIDLDNQTLWPAGYGSEQSAMVWSCGANFNAMMDLSVAYNAYIKRNVDISGDLSVGGRAHINQLGISALSTDHIYPYSNQTLVDHHNTLCANWFECRSLKAGGQFFVGQNDAYFGDQNNMYVGFYHYVNDIEFYIDPACKLTFYDPQSNANSITYVEAAKLLRLCSMLSSEARWNKLEQLLNS